MFEILWIVLNSGIFALPEIMTFSEWHGVFGNNANRQSKFKTLTDREKAFNHNVDKINAHNSKNVSWRMGVNSFSDLNEEEFSKLMGLAACRKHMNETSRLREKHQKRLPQGRNLTNAASVDWRSINNPLGKVAVTPVKDQGECGSCWAFSTSGAVEGAWAVGGNSLVSLSEQQLVSCDKQDYNCYGGYTDRPFEYVRANGLTSEEFWPYVSGSGFVPSCNHSKVTQNVANISGFIDVQKRNENALENALNIGPVAVAVDADGFQHYSSGVMTGACGDYLDHAVLAVGYGHDSDSDLDYWIVKNSWGQSWGLFGYIYLQRHIPSSSGQCGILLEPSYPIAGNLIPTLKPTRRPGPSPYYEDPGENGEYGCKEGEIAVINYQGIHGRMCMPICHAEWDCPQTDVGSGAVGCNFKMGNTKLCAIVCWGLQPCVGNNTFCTGSYQNINTCMYQ